MKFELMDVEVVPVAGQPSTGEFRCLMAGDCLSRSVTIRFGVTAAWDVLNFSDSLFLDEVLDLCLAIRRYRNRLMNELDAVNRNQPAVRKQYRQSTLDIAAEARKMAAEKAAQGFTRADSANELKRMFDHPTGDPDAQESSQAPAAEAGQQPERGGGTVAEVPEPH